MTDTLDNYLKENFKKSFGDLTIPDDGRQRLLNAARKMSGGSTKLRDGPLISLTSDLVRLSRQLFHIPVGGKEANHL